MKRYRGRVGLVNLGCPKNRVDSEIMEAILADRGFSIGESGRFDVVIINTCGFIQDAKEESLGEIFRVLDQKKVGEVGKIIVGGCLSQRYMNELQREIPEVDRFFGIESISQIDEIVSEVLFGLSEGGPGKDCMSLEDRYVERVKRVTSGWTYLKITDGCSNLCAYCTIPLIRGSLKSRDMKKIVDEFKAMIDGGIKEVNLIGQDIGSFGKDRHESESLSILLEEMSALAPDDMWIRLLYLHPRNISRRLVGVIKGSLAVINYLDIPVQHSSNRILEKMDRGYTKEYLYDLFMMLRETLEGLVVRTTIMVGFPGEEKEDVDQLIDLVQDIRFDRLGGFLYSREEGTAASRMGPHIPRDEALSRLDEILTVQSQISLEKNHDLLGKRLKVLIEEVPAGQGSPTGRYYGQAPEVDGVVTVEQAERFKKGDFLMVEVTDFDHYDLYGSVVL